VHFGSGWCYAAGLNGSGTLQCFDVRIGHRSRFGAVRLSEFLLSLSGWLVLGQLVAGDVVWQAPWGAVRCTLIVASTEYEFSSGFCRVFHPDLADAQMRWPATTAFSGRLFFRWCVVRLVGGLRGCGILIERTYFRPRRANGAILLAAGVGSQSWTAVASACASRGSVEKTGVD
jgi:hypothetical protein